MRVRSRFFRGLQTRTVFEQQRGQPTHLSAFPLWKSQAAFIFFAPSLQNETGFFLSHCSCFPLFTRISLQLSLIPTVPLVLLPLVLRSAFGSGCARTVLWMKKKKKVTTCRLWRLERTSQSDQTDRWNRPLCRQKGELRRGSRSR